MPTTPAQTTWTGPGGRHRSPARPEIKPANSDSAPPRGLRTQLQSLLPRHALFHARVKIHQISSVPLVHGEFAARWKFRNVQSQTGLLHRVKERRKKDEKGKGKEVDQGGSGESADTSSSSTSISEEQSSNTNIPSVVVSGYTSPTLSHPTVPYQYALHSPYAEFSRTNSSFPPASASSTSNSHPSSSALLSANSNLSSLPNTSIPPTPSTPTTPNIAVENYSSARGITSFYKLKEHAVVWEHQLDVVIKMDVDRETSELLPNEFKIVIMQRVITGDPDAPRNPRLGALYLDLSEYAGVGKEVTRSYLLRDTKMNATLKLTVFLEHVGGDTNYIAPPLPKGEILNGVADLLEDDVYLTRPRALDLWGPYHNQQELEMDLLGGAKIPELQSAAGKARSKSRTRARSKSRQRQHNRTLSYGKDSLHSAEDSDEDEYEDAADLDGEEPRYEVPFDVSRLPLAYGPKTTEMLIEAIFNPVRVTNNDRRENPFTYYMSPEDVRKEQEERERRMDQDRTVRLRNGQFGGEGSSVYSAEDNSSAGHTGSSSSHDNGDIGRGRVGGVKGWWSKKKLGSSATPIGRISRPGTPVPVQ